MGAPGDERSQGISNHDIDHVEPEKLGPHMDGGVVR